VAKPQTGPRELLHHPGILGAGCLGVSELMAILEALSDLLYEDAVANSELGTCSLSESIMFVRFPVGNLG
jgi:hypothetical protein